AGPADAGDENVVRTVERGLLGLGQRREEGLGVGPRGARPAQARAFERDEARAESLEARVVLVARVLIDGALAPELGLERQDRDAVRLRPAVAATFADRGVDEHALRGLRVLPLLAPPALLGGAGLVVDEHRDAAVFAQLPLHRVELGPVVHRRE